jgi:ubiquinone/menaquinone biosynthesis C-methylase UbiE
MDHFIEIYHHRAADYHRMITPEDTEGNLLPALERVTPLTGKRILDVGSGTGRLPLLFGRRAAQIIGVDLHADMLREQQRHAAWPLLQSDMRCLPFQSDWFQVVTAGWAIGHFVGWYGEQWAQEMGQVLAEMHRVAAPGGSLLIMETLTTGSHTPAPPTEGLARYYAWLETEWGFTRQEIATDYQFESVAEAVNRTEFFFGAEFGQKVRQEGWTRVPEWTGVWGKTLA